MSLQTGIMLWQSLRPRCSALVYYVEIGPLFEVVMDSRLCDQFTNDAQAGRLTLH